MVAIVHTLLFCITCLVVHFAGIFLHELGHVAGAWLCGWKPFVLKVGSGPVRSSFRLGDLELRWTMAPYSGFAQAFTTSRRLFRLRKIIFVLAGPVVTGGVIAWLWWASAAVQIDSPSWLSAALQVSSFAQIGMLFFCVWPMWVTVDGDRLPNDMLQVCKALVMSGKDVGREIAANIGGAAAMFIERGEKDRAKLFLARFKDVTEEMRSVDLDCLWIHLLRAVGRKEEAQAIMRAVIDGGTESGQSRSEVLDGIDCLPLYYGYTDLLEEGLGLIEIAIAASPDVITLKGTQGALLIEMGRVDEGCRLVEKVAAETKSQNDIAIASYYRALAFAKSRDLQRAQEVLQKAFKEYPDCIVRKRVAALVWDEVAKPAEKKGC